MSVVGQNILAGTSANQAAYTIDQSLRFTRGDQSYLERTAGTPTDGKKLTASVWVKGPSTVGGGVMLEARSADWDWWGIDAGVSQSHPEMRCYLYGAQNRADGADVKLKDGGTNFGRFTNSGGELVIKSGSSATTAATFSGANVTFAGTLAATSIDGGSFS